MDAKNWHINLGTSVAMFILIVCYQPYWDMAGFNYSLAEIVVIQKKLGASAENAWAWWAHWGLNGATYLPIIVPYIFGLSQRPRACYYAMYMSLVICLLNTLKSTYAEARPFWMNIAIIPGECTT